MFPLILLLSLSPTYGQLCSSAGWSAADRDGIVIVHNTLRSSIAKGIYVAKGTVKNSATNMAKINYDCSLEESAQIWADSCPSGHSHSPGKGENMFWSYSTAPISVDGLGAAASTAWEGEFQKFGWASNNLTLTLFNTGIGHATQMAWATTTMIGCGVKSCPSNLSGFQYMMVVVCQYTPQGNILTQNIYNEGIACSACPSDTTCDVDTKLCQ